MRFHGGCHCGNIAVVFETELSPDAIEIRACQCSFCRKHASRAVADPAGRALISAKEINYLGRYRFGFETAEYLICSRCGVYVAAVTTGAEEQRAIVILNGLDQREAFTGPLLPMDYDGESRAERIARRRARWTPVTVR